MEIGETPKGLKTVLESNAAWLDSGLLGFEPKDQTASSLERQNVTCSPLACDRAPAGLSDPAATKAGEKAIRGTVGASFQLGEGEEGVAFFPNFSNFGVLGTRNDPGITGPSWL